MPSTINTNLAAYSAQANIRVASDASAASVSRLSSGNRIVKASDDVAALSAGTLLRTTVSTLRAAQVNTALGSSLLQVADGGLSQINEILQRQKYLATQATSGSLSSTERALLNQEFQGLVSEIDRLASNTKFNQVSLLSGALSGATTLTSKTIDSAAAAGATTASVVTIVSPAAGDKITINGVTVEFAAATSTPGSTAANGKVIIGASVTETALNVVSFLNASTDPRAANFRFTNAAGAISVNYGGGLLNGAFIVDATSTNTTNVTVNTAANRTIATTNPLDGLGLDRTSAIGNVSGTLFVNGGTTAALAGQAVNTRTVINNADFVGTLNSGKIGKITAVYSTTDTAVFSLKVGDFTYTTAATDVTNAATVALTFTGTKDSTGVAGGGSFVLTLRGGADIPTFDTQAELDPITAQINSALAGVTFSQNRDISTFQEGQLISVGGVDVANLNGFSANLRASSFTGATIESIKVTAPAVGSTDATLQIVINGETYVSVAGIGNQIGLNTQISLQSVTNPNNAFVLVTGNSAIGTSATTTVDLSTQAYANAFQKGLEDAFGLTGAGAKIGFQVGTTSTDTIGVQIKSASTSSLYSGASLNILDTTAATTASSALDTAINALTSIRANIGALQSRFNFAAASIDSAVQNTDAARSVLLDTDVAAESTNYATNQVKLQAGISVLAQANQQLQALLKLLG